MAAQASQLLLISSNILHSGMAHLAQYYFDIFKLMIEPIIVNNIGIESSDTESEFDNRIVTVLDKDMTATANALTWNDVTADLMTLGCENISSDNCYQLAVDSASMALDPAKRSDIIVTVRVTFASQPDLPSSCIDPTSQQQVIDGILPKLLLTHFNTNRIDEFLLAYPNIINDDSKAPVEKRFLSSLEPVWKYLQNSKATVTQWGVCDFNSRQLETLVSDLGTVPDINQVFYKYHNCCDQPHHDLLKFCKTNGVKLLTHGDNPAKYVPTPTAIRALMRKHGILLDRSSDIIAAGSAAVPVDISNKSPRSSKSHSDIQVNRSIDTRWIAEITTRSRSRDVALAKHFIVHVSTLPSPK